MLARGIVLLGLTGGLIAGSTTDAKADGPYRDRRPMWSGFYVGVHAGYGWASTDSEIFDINDNPSPCEFNCTDNKRDGPFAGVQLGYNWVTAPGILVGVEADISAANLTGTTGGCSDAGCSETDVKTNALATLRGRIGYARGNWLIYGTGGFAWAHSEADRTITVTNPPSALEGQTASAGGWVNGWVAGGGVEWALSHNTSLKLEYQHLQFNDVTSVFEYPGFQGAYRRVVSDTSSDTVRVGLNVRLDWDRRTEPLK